MSPHGDVCVLPLSPCAAFNIETANIRSTTSTVEIGRMRLMWWRQAIEQGRAGKPPDHPVAQALAQAQAQHSLSFRFLEQLLDAREADLETKQPADLRQLLSYCERTAGALQVGGHRPFIPLAPAGAPPQHEHPPPPPCPARHSCSDSNARASWTTSRRSWPPYTWVARSAWRRCFAARRTTPRKAAPISRRTWPRGILSTCRRCPTSLNPSPPAVQGTACPPRSPALPPRAHSTRCHAPPGTAGRVFAGASRRGGGARHRGRDPSARRKEPAADAPRVGVLLPATSDGGEPHPGAAAKGRLRSLRGGGRGAQWGAAAAAARMERLARYVLA